MKFATEEIAEKAFEAGYEMFMELDEAPKGDFNTVLNDFDVFRAGTSIYDIWFWIECNYGDACTGDTIIGKYIARKNGW